MKTFNRRRKQVCQAARWLSENGFFGGTLGSGGNVSLLDRSAGVVIITPSGKPYHQMAAEDICVVDLDMRQQAGELPPSIEVGMHLAIYRKREDISAVVHTHQTFASVLSVINQPIPALFDEITMEIGPTVEIIPYAVSGSKELARNVASRLDNGCCCYIIQNHGALNLGRDMATALKNAELLEKAAQVYTYALCTGRKISRLPEDALRHWQELRKDGA